MFRTIVDRTALPVVVVERDGSICYASPRIDELAGWTPEEVVGRNLLEFLAPGQLYEARDGLAEILVSEDGDPGIPVVFNVLRRDGGELLVEVAAAALGEQLVLRLRSFESTHYRSAFIRALLADAPLPEVLVPLTRSVAAATEGLGAAVHHGYDGASFEGVVGSWPAAASLPLDGEPWRQAVLGGGIQTVPATDAVAAGLGAGAWWLVPVGGAHTQPAVLSVGVRDEVPPLLGHRNVLAEGADLVELALVRVGEHERLRHLARRDPLTSLWNRATFHDMLTAALAEGASGLAVAYCDLDGFKAVNDRYGHRVGDEVLVHAAARLRNSLRSGDELARIGGDEFTVLCRDVDGAATAEEVGHRLLASLAEPFTVPGGTATIGLSVGISLARAGDSLDDLLVAADAALYRAKQAGGRHVVVAS